jgi:hypothetical protein
VGNLVAFFDDLVLVASAVVSLEFDIEGVGFLFDVVVCGVDNRLFIGEDPGMGNVGSSIAIGSGFEGRGLSCLLI